VHALVATGDNGAGHRAPGIGHREILGLQVSSAEDGAGWLAFFRDLTARGRLCCVPVGRACVGSPRCVAQIARVSSVKAVARRRCGGASVASS
jgi:hypothetical protein